jgi:hypothetical protein
MATAEQHDVVIRWQQQGQAAIQAEAKGISQSFSSLGASLTKGLSAASASIKKSLASVGTQAKQTGAIMSAAVTGPILLMAKQSIDAASDLNESMSAVKTVFGDSADEVLNFSRNAASSLGQSQNAALSMASALGALFQSIGLNNSQMADFTMNLETASADLGSFFNADPSEVLNALKSGLVGEAEPLRRFGILLNDAAVQAEGVKMGLINAGDEMTDQQKVMARYSLIMSQIGAAQGDFARTSDGLANSQRILSSEIQDLQADIGGLLLPAMKDWVNLLKNAVGWVRNLSPEAKDLAVKIGLIAAAAGPVLVVLGQLATVVGALASGPLLLAAGAALALYKAFESNFLGIRDLVTSVIDRVGQYVGRVVEFFQHAKERGLDPFSLAFRTMIVTIGEQLGAGNPLVEFLQGVYRNAKKLADYITGTFVNAIGSIATSFQTGNLDQIPAIFEKLGTDIKGGWDKTVGAWVNDLTNLGQTAADNIVSGIQATNWQVVGDEIGTQVRGSLASLDQFSEWIFQAMTGAGGGGGTPGNTPGGGLPAGGLASELGVWVRGQIQQTDWDSVHAEVNKGMASGNFIADFVGWANQQGIDLHNQIASYVNTEIPQIDWQQAKDLLATNGQDLLGQLLQGFGNAMADISTWISGGAGNGGGESQGLGARISSMISGSFAQATDDLIAAGKYPFEQLLQGMQDEWQAIVDWASTLNPADLIPRPPQSSDPNDPVNNPDQSRRTRDGTTGQAYGGLGGGWTWVGERGRELVKLARGSMVIPAGASETRARAMAYGGVLGSRPEGEGITDTSRLKRLSPDEWRAYKMLTNSYGVARHDAINDITANARRLAARSGMTRPGFTLAEDGTWVRDSYYAAGGSMRDLYGPRHERPRWGPDWQAAHPDATRDEIRQNREGYRSGSYGSGIHVYGNVTIHPPNADVAGEISRQFQTRNR